MAQRASSKATGTSTGTLYRSPARLKRDAARRRAEERRWAQMAGPVTVSWASGCSPDGPNTAGGAAR